MHDLVIRGGTIVDGTGEDPFTGDVAVDGQVIAQVGGKAGAARQELDAAGLLVTPGFVDIHTHYDAQATWDPLLGSSCWHGVTTAVMGNCGVGFAPVRPEHRDWLVGLMQGVEDIPREVLNAGLPWTWESFPEYLDALDTLPRAIDIAAQVPHAPVRVYAMGERGLDGDQCPDGSQLEAIRRLVGEALQAGAVGVSTLRTRMHRGADGRLIPTYRASDAELMALAAGMSDGGRGTFEIASDYSAGTLDEEFARYREFARRSGRPVSVPLLQDHSAPEEWRDVMEQISAACREGLAFSAQTAVRPVGVAMGLDSRAHLFSSCPSYQQIGQLPLADRVAMMHRPAIKDRILREAGSAAPGLNLGRLFAMKAPIDYEPDADTSIAARAVAANLDPLELAYDILLENGGQTYLYGPVRNFASGDCEVVRELLQSPLAVPGLGDGGAHCTQICDVSFPTSLLTHWGRDRRSGGLFSIASLVRMQTSDTARLYGLHDRGTVTPGRKADVNVIDFERLAVRPPVMAYDFPAGGKRLTQRADGYRATVLAGVITFADGEHTGAWPGRVVRA
ncbi:MAG TPA: amidohydrolase family protein [Acidimicrobiales bacterium]